MVHGHSYSGSFFYFQPDCGPGLPDHGPGVNRSWSQITKIVVPEYHFLTPQWESLSKYRTSGKKNPRGHVSAIGATFQDQLALMADPLFQQCLSSADTVHIYDDNEPQEIENKEIKFVSVNINKGRIIAK